jgi:rhamnosyltransferase
MRVALQFLAGDGMSGPKQHVTATWRETVGVAVITHKAAAVLSGCLSPLLACTPVPRVIVVNSSSNDGTVELAKAMGAEVLVIPREEFNHGATRELARQALGTDIVMMITPDARPLGPETVRNLVRPILHGEASIAYARQLPRDGADFFEAFSRCFNYREKSEVRSIQDIGRLGAYTFFCSNSCAAWSNRALDSIGGFAPTLSLEDVIATAELLHAGHQIAYCADAVVVHSHRYTLAEEFKRHFDTGYVRAMHKDRLFVAGGDERRGVIFVAEMLRQLTHTQPQLIPYAITNIAAKYLGYCLGFHGHALPTRLKRHLSGQSYFWKVPAAGQNSSAIRPRAREIA